MNQGIKIGIISVLFTLLFGCEKKEPVPVPPVITFLDATLSPDNTFSIVRFEFYDVNILSKTH